MSRLHLAARVCVSVRFFFAGISRQTFSSVNKHLPPTGDRRTEYIISRGGSMDRAKYLYAEATFIINCGMRRSMNRRKTLSQHFIPRPGPCRVVSR